MFLKVGKLIRELFFTQAQPLLLEQDIEWIDQDRFYRSLISNKEFIKRVTRPWSLLDASMTCRTGMTDTV